MNLFTALLCLLAGSTTVSALAQDTPKPAAHKHRVVFQISVNDPERWTGALANAENLQTAFGPGSTEIEMVCFGKGLDLLLRTDTPLAERIAKDHTAGMTFAACQNTMRARKLTPADLLPAAVIVDSGVAEIVRKQEAGWSYLKG